MLCYVNIYRQQLGVKFYELKMSSNINLFHPRGFSFIGDISASLTSLDSGYRKSHNSEPGLVSPYSKPQQFELLTLSGGFRVHEHRGCGRPSLQVLSLPHSDNVHGT